MRSEMLIMACMTCSIMRMVMPLSLIWRMVSIILAISEGLRPARTSSRSKQIRLGAQGPGQLQALFLGDVEAAGGVVGLVGQPHLGQDILGHPGGFGQGQLLPAVAGPHHDVFPHRQVGERPDHLVGPGQAAAGHLVGRKAGDVLILEHNPAVFRFKHPVDGIEQRGLAGAVGADETQDLPGAQLKGDIAQRLEPAEALGDVPDLEDHSSTPLSLGKRRRSQPTAPAGTNRMMRSRATPEIARCRFLNKGLTRR